MSKMKTMQNQIKFRGGDFFCASINARGFTVHESIKMNLSLSGYCRAAEMAAANDKLVCVTGASGFIASWLVKLLLRRGYTVNATLRNPDDPRKVEHLKAFEGAEERLHLFKANLVEEGSFDSAIRGCYAVFHTASPVAVDTAINDPQPAVKGTVNVIRSCAKAGCVKRVVFTSSMATMMAKRSAYTANAADVSVDETWFSDPLFVREIQRWYVLSKILAEEAAMKQAQENGIDLVVMNPGLVLGPLLQPTLNETSQCFLTLITQGDTKALPGGILVHVDVRDVAEAHILALENPSANGRYCLVQNVYFACQVFDILRQLYPSITFPFSPKENEGGEPSVRVCNDKAKSLGLNFISLEQSVKDTIQSLIDKNLFNFTMLPPP